MLPQENLADEPIITVAVWHNTNPSQFVRGWHPDDPMTKAYSYDIPAEQARDPEEVLEEAFEICNVGNDERAQAYRALGNRSLSVGDVIVIGEVAHVCTATGWDLVQGTITVAGGASSTPSRRT
ncbi:hypothetical protein OG339_48085 (plasmid) [Streptosporangium sp. NBC_01495]|uniref:hypothetical protein n=1 Tax=Streptosporangium sp. NBC_01495 TaxID=2903899 RepID=UPI002E37BD69|nr:hypothetical protein [Streptosporangium sp. NBC_01495]